MQYKNLNFLILNSSSSKKYYNSLPNNVKEELQNQRNFIHTQFELRRNAEYIQKYSQS